jgi:DnaJ-class molecular chaperone
MTKKPAANPNEKRCPACDGTGSSAVEKPAQPGRRIYPPPCVECDGKGRIPKAEADKVSR